MTRSRPWRAAGTSRESALPARIAPTHSLPFVAERVVDPDSGIGDLAVPAHRMTQYAETAALVDASGDPRVGALQDVLAELRQAESVEVTEYAATRD